MFPTSSAGSIRFRFGRPAAAPPAPDRGAASDQPAAPDVRALAVIILIYLYSMTLSSPMARVEFLRWAKVNDAIRDGEYYRLFTSMFLHLNLMHIPFNGYALNIIGRDVEGLFGHLRFAVIISSAGCPARRRASSSPTRPRWGPQRSSRCSGRRWSTSTSIAACTARWAGTRTPVLRDDVEPGARPVLACDGFRSTTPGTGGLVGGVCWRGSSGRTITCSPTRRRWRLTVIDRNPIQLGDPSLLYAVLAAALVYAVTA